MPHLSITPSTANDVISRVAEAVLETRKEIAAYTGDHPEFADIGNRMSVIWQEGVDGFVK